MKTEAARAAGQIKGVLKKEFPTVKFSVKSSNFANGNSVDVRWNLGPTTDQVDKHIRQYQYGHFDGMIDMYENSNSRSDIPQAKFVHSQRDYMTDEEIEVSKNNAKFHWRDPRCRSMYDEGKTLYHIIAQDLCKAMGIEYKGLDTVPPQEFQHMARRNYDAGVRDFVYPILQDTALMDGYHGIRNEKDEEGHTITNGFEVY